MSNYFSEGLVQGVRAVYDIIARFGRINYPGTNIPVLGFIIGFWAIYFFYRWIIAQVFDVEVNK